MLPVTPTFIGGDPVFMRRMAALSSTLPDIFRRLDSLKLAKAYRGIKGLKFLERMIGGDPVYYHPREDCLYVYPMAFMSGQRPDILIYRGFGQRYQYKFLSAQQKLQWAKKYVYPSAATIDRLAGMLDGRSTFEEILRRFTEAAERLQVIHVLNALTANAVNHQSAGTIDLGNYPPTAEFAKCRRPFSLTPLTSAYSNRRLDKYEDAFAEYCSRNGQLHVSEQSVRDGLLELFRTVTFH